MTAYKSVGVSRMRIDEHIPVSISIKHEKDKTIIELDKYCELRLYIAPDYRNNGVIVFSEKEVKDDD